ncbi:MAG: hypothetical protein JXA28_08470 [Bacteroidetes bacterium]|nr:hypothetical protein [Bacteroidota bacterium]
MRSARKRNRLSARDTGQEVAAARESLAARIESLTVRLAYADSELERARKREERCAFAVEQTHREIRETITGTRSALEHHREMVSKAGLVCAQCLRIIAQRELTAEPARSIYRDRELVLQFALNILSDECKIGSISLSSPLGRIIARVRLEMDQREGRARGTQPKRRNLALAGMEEFPALMQHADRLLGALSRPARCRKIGRASRMLTRMILGFAQSTIHWKNDGYLRSFSVPSIRFSVLHGLLKVRRSLFLMSEVTKNTRDRLLHASRDDERLSVILQTSVTVGRDYMLSRHEMLKWNDAVYQLVGSFQQLQKRQDEWDVQLQVVQAASVRQERWATSLANAKALYEKICQVPWRKDPIGPVIAAVPTTPSQMHKKKRHVEPKYLNPVTEENVEDSDAHGEYFTVRETDQWHADLKELPEEVRNTFVEAAHSISRTQRRQTIGRIQGKAFYSMPVGAYGRFVYSIQSGIAVLERAFGKPSRAEDYRYYRKNIRKGNG